MAGSDAKGTKVQKVVEAVTYLLKILQENTKFTSKECTALIHEIKRVLRGVYFLSDDNVDYKALYAKLALETNLLEILGQVLSLPDDTDKIDVGERLSWNTQMKLHTIDCLINIYYPPEMVTAAQDLLEEII